MSRSATRPCASAASRGALVRRRSIRWRGPPRRGSGPPKAALRARATRGSSRDARADAVRAVRASSAVLSSDEDALDWLVDRAPLVLVWLVAAQQVKPVAALFDCALQELGQQHDPRREVPRIRVD